MPRTSAKVYNPTERFTISLDPDLARRFDAFIAQGSYQNRSEAVRDLIRQTLDVDQFLTGHADWCAATVSYVYDRSDHVVAQRVLQLQHDHHDLVVTSQQTPLDHHNSLVCTTLRGKTDAVRMCASRLTALRGVRYGQVHLVALHQMAMHTHASPHTEPHSHFEPMA